MRRRLLKKVAPENDGKRSLLGIHRRLLDKHSIETGLQEILGGAEIGSDFLRSDVVQHNLELRTCFQIAGHQID